MIKSLIASVATLVPSLAMATIVQFQTSLGEIEVNLFDEETPITVKNFLTYVENDDYDNSTFHRSVEDFIIQGGGFKVNSGRLEPLSNNGAIINEPKFSNAKGTIAMAKLGGDPNSATNQWFFNLENNAANLDNQNGGFTVFGQIIGGEDVIDALRAVRRFSFSDFSDVPLIDWEPSDGTAPTNDNYIILSNIAIIDAAPDTAAGLSPALTTRSSSSEQSSSAGNEQNTGESGGSVSIPFILFLTGLLAALKLVNRRQRQD